MHTPNKPNATTSSNVMKTFLIIIGIIAVIILILFGIFRTFDSSDGNVQGDVNITTETKNPLLNTSQEASLEAIGINSASLPSEITPAMQVCFTEKLGEERAQEIAGGDSPTVTDYVKARSCLNIE
jgi:FtsZ-interacting cell division protein ZipA